MLENFCEIQADNLCVTGMKAFLLLFLLLCVNIGSSRTLEIDRYRDDIYKKPDYLPVKLRPYDPGKGESQNIRKTGTWSIKLNTKNRKPAKKFSKNIPKGKFRESNPSKMKSSHGKRKSRGTWVKVHRARLKGKAKSNKENSKNKQNAKPDKGICCNDKDYANNKGRATSSKSSKQSSSPLFVALLLFPSPEAPPSAGTDSQHTYSNNEPLSSFLPKISPPPKIPPSPTSCPAQSISIEGCGRISAWRRMRIVNGLGAYLGEFPWAVLLLAVMSDGRLTGQCGGTLITSGWIISAAHCFHRTYNYDIVLATMGSVKMPEDYTSMQSIFQVIIHPQYNERTLDNDIALLQLVDYASFTDFISPVCLATPGEDDHMNSHDSRATAVGWGFLKQNDNKPSMWLQRVNLDVITLDRCRQYYSGPFYPITEGNMCTYTKGKDACQGDSGGGLYHLLTSGRWVQVGVVSWGIGCAQEGNPGVYTRIVDKLTWITTVINTTTC